MIKFRYRYFHFFNPYVKLLIILLSRKFWILTPLYSVYTHPCLRVKNISNLIGRFFLFKKSRQFWLTGSFELVNAVSTVGQVCFGLHDWMMYDCAGAWWFCLLLRLCLNRIWSKHFIWLYCMFFLSRNCQISDDDLFCFFAFTVYNLLSYELYGNCAKFLVYFLRVLFNKQLDLLCASILLISSCFIVPHCANSLFWYAAGFSVMEFPRLQCLLVTSICFFSIRMLETQ